MPPRQRDVRVRVLSEHDDKGFKSAEASAKVIERELNKLEQAQRSLANMQMAAAREMAAAEAQKAAAVVESNRRQAEAMDSFGRKTLAVTAAVAVGLGLTARAAMSWESAWAGVTKTVDGNAEEMAQLQDELRGLARVLPATHEEIAGVAEAAGQLGVKRQDIAAFTRTMINMGETTNLSADEAATSIAQFSNVMGIGADQASNLGAAIVALGNDGASTEADIMSMGLRIAGAGRTAGLTASEVLAVASALSSVGIEAEAGGSAISRVMTQIESDVSSGKSTIGDYARVAGMSADQFATAWQENAAGALTVFVQGLGEMQASGQDTTATLEQLGFADLRVADTLRRASLAGDLLSESIQTGNTAFEENIALVEEANKRYQTTEARLQIARNQINDAAIDIGGNFLPAVAAGSEKVGALATAFGALSPQAQSWVSGLGAAAVGLGTVVGGAAIAIPKLKELGETITNLQGGSSRMGKAIGGAASVLAGPWGLALAGATVAVGAWATAQGEALQKVHALADGIDSVTGNLNEAGRAWVTNELNKSQSFGIFGVGGMSSMIEESERFGVSLETITKAYTDTTEAGQAAADAALAAADAYEAANPLSIAAEARAVAYRNAIVDQRDRMAEGIEVSKNKAATEEAGAAVTEQATAATEAAAAAAQEQAESSEAAAEALKEWMDMASEADASFVDIQGAYDAVVGKNTELAQSSADATSSTKDSWEDFYDGISVSIADYLAELEAQVAAQSAWEQNMLLLSGRVSQGVIDDLARLGPEGAPLVAQLVNASDEELARLETVYGQRSDEATGEFADNLRRAAPVIAAAGAQLGTEAANEIAAKLASGEMTIQQVLDAYDLDVVVPVDADTQPALSEIQQLWNRYDRKQMTVFINAQVSTSGGGRALVQADGGVVEYYAGGGIREQHVAQIAPAGAMRVWAEPETGGEAYIPMSPAKRPRSEAILQDVAHQFGMYVQRYADGAMVGAAAPTSSGAAGVDLVAAFRQALTGVTWEVDGQPIRTIARTEASGVVMAGVRDGSGRSGGEGWVM